MGATHDIASFVSEARFESLPAEVVRCAKESFLDTLGIALAGAVELGGRIVMQYIVKKGGLAQSSVMGCATKVPASAAALANGTLAHIVGFSDFSVPNLLHPSVAVLPAAWALAEASRADGKALLLAHVLGVEVSCKIARVLTAEFTQRGFHPCAVVGAFGAAAASAKLLGLDANQISCALGIAGVQAAGIKVSLGTMSKAFAVGNAAESGVTAAELAAAGYTGARDVLEGQDGFFQTFGAGVNSIDFHANLGKPYEFETPGITIKPYPACTRAHPAIDAALEVAQHAFSIDAIERVECEVAPAVLQVVRIENPRNPMQAKFSLPYCIASSLCDREMVMDTFTEQRFMRSNVVALMKKVRTRSVEDLASAGPFAARVLVHLTKGTLLQSRKERNLWNERGVPSVEKRQQLLAKYRNCAGRVLNEEQIEQSIGIVDALEDQQDLEELFRVVRVSTREREHDSRIDQD